MTRLTLLSNGHGEDAVGAQLARELRALRPGLELRAFPVVGEGAAYEHLGLEVLGPARALPSGGLTLHAPELLWADLKAGLVGLTARQLRDLARLDTDVLLVIGDVYAQALGSLVRARLRFVVQTLVSARHREGGGGRPSPPGRYFMEAIRYPERLLMRHLARRVYVRDEPTAALLRAHGVSRALALGNPMIDALDGRPIAELDTQRVLALLPGTRAYAERALTLMLAALERLPEATAAVAWAGAGLPATPGWELRRGGAADAVLERGGRRVYLYRDRFADVLASAWVAVGTSGTANEQAAALGLPVVSFPVPPLYGDAFLANQKRLLGEALILCPAAPEAVAAAVTGLRDPDRYHRAAAAGRERMGSAGGSRAIAADVLACVDAASLR